MSGRKQDRGNKHSKIESAFLSRVRIGELFEIVPGAIELQGFPTDEGDVVIAAFEDSWEFNRVDLFDVLGLGDPPESCRIKPGDVLLGVDDQERDEPGPAIDEKASYQLPHGEIVKVATEREAGALIGFPCLALRSRSSSPEASVVGRFLALNVGAEVLRKACPDRYRHKELCDRLSEVKVPVLPYRSVELLAECEALQEASSVDLVVMLSDAEERVLEVRNAAELNRALLDLKTMAHAINEALSVAENLDYRIRNFYPYPLAFPYRSLRSISSPERLLREQLRVAENLLAFLGSLALSLLEHPPQPADLDIKAHLRSGLTPGDWIEVGTRCASSLTMDRCGNLAVGLQSLWSSKQRFRKRAEQLAKLKNDFKHDRGPQTEQEVQEANKILSDLLRDCTGEVSFLLQFPIRLVTDVDVDLKGRGMLTTLKFTGDHPALQQETIQHHRGLPRNSLFVEIDEDRWISLSPFLTARNCPKCQNREIYFVDRSTKQGVVLKSFERGHAFADSKVAEAISAWLDPTIAI